MMFLLCYKLENYFCRHLQASSQKSEIKFVEVALLLQDLQFKILAYIAGFILCYYVTFINRVNDRKL